MKNLETKLLIELQIEALKSQQEYQTAYFDAELLIEQEDALSESRFYKRLAKWLQDHLDGKLPKDNNQSAG